MVNMRAGYRKEMVISKCHHTLLSFLVKQEEEPCSGVLLNKCAYLFAVFLGKWTEAWCEPQYYYMALCVCAGCSVETLEARPSPCCSMKRFHSG